MYSILIQTKDSKVIESSYGTSTETPDIAQEKDQCREVVYYRDFGQEEWNKWQGNGASFMKSIDWNGKYKPRKDDEWKTAK